jgi:guanosine-3',5'-bis(diphosphate) 3'-pyrophosphohydrolase
MSQYDQEAMYFEAVSFAARAHRHQLRKDHTTPYVAHPFRVGLVVRQIFGIDDPRVLTTAILHDTIEDTTTDHDDLAELFGTEIAMWVGQLSKDMRLPETEREAAYIQVLSKADWQVQICKLADIYDNTRDSVSLTAEKRRHQVTRVQAYLAAIRTGLKPQAEAAFRMTEKLVREEEARSSVA